MSATTVRPAGADQIERYTYTERLCHWITGLAYVYCMATGLAFYTPYLFWVAAVLGGGPTARFLHPIVGVCFFAAQMWMHFIWHGEAKFTAQDRAWMDHVNDYVTNHDGSVPAQWKFNAGQKLYYWAMFYGAFGLLLTGIVMWFPEYDPPGLFWLRPVVIILHCAFALLTIGAFIIHVYMSLFTVPGSLHAMVSGYVSRDWARTHHRLWYEKVTGESRDRS
jgi:formate dehydrogenase subunit gamma